MGPVDAERVVVETHLGRTNTSSTTGRTHPSTRPSSPWGKRRVGRVPRSERLERTRESASTWSLSAERGRASPRREAATGSHDRTAARASCDEMQVECRGGGRSSLRRGASSSARFDGDSRSDVDPRRHREFGQGTRGAAAPNEDPRAAAPRRVKPSRPAATRESRSTRAVASPPSAATFARARARSVCADVPPNRRNKPPTCTGRAPS